MYTYRNFSSEKGRKFALDMMSIFEISRESRLTKGGGNMLPPQPMWRYLVSAIIISYQQYPPRESNFRASKMNYIQHYKRI